MNIGHSIGRAAFEGVTRSLYAWAPPSLLLGAALCSSCGSSSSSNGQATGGAPALGGAGAGPMYAGASGSTVVAAGGAPIGATGSGGTNTVGAGGSIAAGGIPSSGSGGATVTGAGGAPSGGSSTTHGGTSGASGGTAGAIGGSAGTAGGGNAGAGSGGADTDGGTSDAGCPRATLSSTVDAYYEALAAHDSSTLTLASNARFTENATEKKLGTGLVWPTAGAVEFKRSLLDTDTCNSVTESVIPNSGSDTIYGLRLKLVGGQISEIETIVVDPKSGWFPTPMGLLNSASDNWEMTLPADQQTPRSKMEDIVKGYFQLFANGDVSSFPFASDCKRLENGFSPGACNFGIGGLGAMVPRLIAVDTEAGIAAGFVLFAGSLDDFHMFKIGAGQVHGVHAVVGPAVTSPGWPK